MFSPSSYRTPRKPVSPSRFTIWNTPSPARGFKTPAASPFMSTGKKRRTPTSIISRSPALRGFARTGGVYGRFQPSGVETKFADMDLSVAGVPNSSNAFGWSTLNQIPVGDGPSARIGRSITITSVQVQYALDIHHTEQNAIYLRFMIVLDKQCNGAAATATDIMNRNHILSYRNLDNTERFVVLNDKTIRYSPSALSQAGYVRYQGPTIQSVYRKCNIPITYDNTATSGVIATIRSNNILIFAWISGQQTALNDFKCIGRLRYRDD